MEITTKQVLKFLYILSWIIFVGICIEAGGFIFSTFYILVINPAHATHFWENIDLFSLYSYDPGYFLVEMLLISIAAVLKAILFYLIIRILHEKKLNMSQPFNQEMGRFIVTIAYVALGIGLFSGWGVHYAEWLAAKGVKMPDAQALRIGGADVWMFMGVILYVIAQMFKRGIEIQTENELTI